jgi:hypothetical protein
MKTTLKKYCATMILALTLAFSASAGDMSGPGDSTPPPPPQQQQTSVTGEMSGSGTDVMGDMSGPGTIVELDPITSLALNLLQSVLSIF